MKYPKILCVLSIFIFMGIGVTGTKHVVAEESGLQALRPLSRQMNRIIIKDVTVTLNGIYSTTRLRQKLKLINRTTQIFTGWRVTMHGIRELWM